MRKFLNIRFWTSKPRKLKSKPRTDHPNRFSKMLKHQTRPIAISRVLTVFAYWHTCILTHWHSCTLTNFHSESVCILTKLHTDIHAYWHICILSYLYTYTLTYIYINIHRRLSISSNTILRVLSSQFNFDFYGDSRLFLFSFFSLSL